MDKVILEFRNEDYYLRGPYVRSSQQTNILWGFLFSEPLKDSLDSYIKLLKDQHFKYGMGNVTIFEKHEDGTVRLTLYPFEDMEPEPEFKTTVGNLIKILKDWDYIHKKKFPKVLMTVDGDKVAFERINE